MSFSPLAFVMNPSSSALFYVYYGAAQFIGLITFGASLYLGISYARGNFNTYLPAVMLRFILSVIVAGLYVPLVYLEAQPLQCLALNNSSGLCAYSIPLACVSVLTLVLFTPLASIVQVFYIDTHPRSNNIEACHSGNTYMKYTVVRTISTLLVSLLANYSPQITFALVTLMFWALAINTALEIPYYRIEMNW